ncbi:MAG: WG repeat-containing protein, partial [Lutispora sp.]|nr:WG repeat-containing protein [Lutispora sp.]
MKRKTVVVVLVLLMSITMGLATTAETETSSQPPEFEEEVNSILSIISPSMSDVEKALAVHEYFILNYTYGYTYDPIKEEKSSDSYTAYGIMVNKKGVCEAYSQAYKYMMDRLGIPCIVMRGYVRGGEAHAWNMVCIDENWYHVDVTFDDPNETGRAHRMSFLRSDKGIKETGHTSWQSEVTANSTKYDNAFWINTLSNIFYIDGYWYYVDSGNINSVYKDGFQIIDHSKASDKGLIRRYSFAAGTHQTVHTVLPQTYTYKRSGKPYQTKWLGSDTSLAVDNGILYYNTNNKIFSIDPDVKGSKLVCNVNVPDFMSISTTGKAYIKGIEIKNGTIYYEGSEGVGDYYEYSPSDELYIASTLPTAEPTYTITASFGAGGYISPAETVHLLQNRSRTFTITPREGCVISDVVVDDISIGPVSEYVFGNVTANHSIHARFDMSGADWQLIMLDGEYGHVYSFYEGFAIVENKDYSKRGFIDTSGKQVIPFLDDYDDVYNFNGGLAGVRKNGRQGCIDKSGTLVVPCVYDFVANFADGMALVAKDNKFGFINTSGKLVIPCIYENARDFINGVAWVFKDGDDFFIDTTGNKVSAPENKDDYFIVNDGMDRIYKDGYWGCLNRSREIVVPYIYDEIGEFYEEMAYVCKNNKYGYVNKSGGLVIPCIYDKAENFSGGMARVSMGDKEGYVNTFGELIIPCIYYFGGNFSDGLAWVRGDKGYGYVNTSGELVIPCIYEEAADFREGIAPVKVDDHW